MSTSGETDAQSAAEEDQDQQVSYATEEDITYLMQQMIDLESKIDELQEQVDTKDDRIDQLEKTVDQLDKRTDMLRMVENADQMDGKQRSTALLQHLHRQAQQSDGTASVNKEQAKTALHHPDIARTTYFSDMRRSAKLVGDGDVCWYEKKKESPVDEARLVLNLNNGEIPAPALSTESGGSE